MAKASKKLNDQFQKLDEILAWFEGDEFDLDTADTKFEEGIGLAEELIEKLEKSKLMIEKLETKLPK